MKTSVETETQSVRQPVPSSPEHLEGDSFGIVDLCIKVAKRRNSIALWTMVVAVVSAGISLLLPNVYTGVTKILPPQQTQSIASALLGQIGPLAGLASRDLGIKNSSDTYVAMLESRTVADALIQRYDLQKVYGVNRAVDARDRLAGRTQVVYGKDGLISVSVDDPDPKRAADLANAYVEELFRLMQSAAVSEASQRRAFFEGQMQSARAELVKAEQVLRVTQEKTGLIQLDSQAKAIIEGMSQLRAQIAAREVELQGMRSFATAQNPDVIRMQNEISAMRSQLAKLESEEARGKGDIQIGTSRIPAAGLQYIQALRDVKYYETIFELLAKQFEAAKIDEAKSASVVQVVDKAIVPEKKSKPARALIVLFATLFAFFASVIVVLLQDQFERADPEQLAKLRILQQYLFRRQISS